MIYTHEHLTQDQKITADVCIIGSGAGGSAAAYSLSRAGFKVAVLEAGSFLTPSQFNQRENTMFPKLFYGSGGRRTADRAIRVLHGHGVGGSTLHNINLCKRVPDELLNQWQLRHLTSETFRPYLEQVETLLQITKIEESQMNLANQLFRKGTEKLKYRGAILRHNRKGCVGSGFCELGCAYDAKMNALRVLIPEAVHAGASVYANTRALRIETAGSRATQVIAEVFAPTAQTPQAHLTMEARVIVCAGGAIETPPLLQRSSVPDPHKLIGSRLHLHPGVVAAGVFEQRVNAWQGVPQSFECTEFLSFERESKKRIWIIAGAAHPAGAASLLPGMREEHSELMRLFPHFVPLSAMVHDQTVGRVSSRGDQGVSIDYVLNKEDREQLTMGLRESSRILLAAGAKEVIIPFQQPLRIRSIGELDRADLAIRELDMVSVHPMSSVWMGTSPESSCLDDTGRLHALDNLFVADTSVYPTSLGVPPQLSTYAMGLYVSEQIRRMLSSGG